MTLAISSRLSIIWWGSSGSYPNKVISYIWARKLVDRGCLAYLAFIHDTSVEPPPMESIPIIWEFIDVFPIDLPRVPPNRDIDFSIDLELSTKSISIPLYRMAPV